MFCKNCGREYSEGKFCSECGSPLEEIQEIKDKFPTLEELRETVIDIEKEAKLSAAVINEDSNTFYISRKEYDAAVENMGVFKAKAKTPFWLNFVAISLSLASFFSFLYLFTVTSGVLATISSLSSYLNIFAIIVALLSFSFASHWYLAAKEYRFLKIPSFILWTFSLSIIAVVFTLACFCTTTIPIMLF